MKKSLFILILLMFQVSLLSAQDEPVIKSSAPHEGEIKTLFKKSNKPMKIGYYIGPEFAYTQFQGRDVFLGGLGLGVIVNHFFSVGLEGYGVLNSGNLWYDFEDTPLGSPTGAYLYGGYGGLKFEFRIFATSPVHISFPILIGGGGMAYSTWQMHSRNYNDNYDGTTLDSDAFFVVEPGVMVEINMLKFIRVGAGITYRYTPNLDLIYTSSGRINNFNAKLSLRFGKF
jgi:hypothetical protein